MCMKEQSVYVLFYVMDHQSLTSGRIKWGGGLASVAQLDAHLTGNQEVLG